MTGGGDRDARSARHVAMRAMLRAFVKESSHNLRRLRLPATPELADWKQWLSRSKVRELHLGQELRATKEWMPHDKDDFLVWYYKSSDGMNEMSGFAVSALKTLTCSDGAVCPDLVGVFRTVRFASLTRLVIRNAYNQYNVMGVAELWTEETLSFPKLEFLSIELFNTKRPCDQTPPRPLITVRNLKHLTRVAPHLQHLHVSCPAGFFVEPPNKENMGVMARTWGEKLQYLYLDPTRPGDATLTLVDVIPFIGRCPHLETFGVGMDIHHFSFPTEEELSAYPSCTNSLTLDLGAPRVNDARAVAGALRRIFPNLRRVIPPIIRTDDDADETRGPAWRQITKLLRESSPRSNKADEP
ncbi:hypothetical protein DL93DRAFT_2091780 [Clavulina sp. PMI_390]|nr:hypothetical protein DL93DRAFT_2091780 [Clavulina sp. PMI_390]